MLDKGLAHASLSHELRPPNFPQRLQSCNGSMDDTHVGQNFSLKSQNAILWSRQNSQQDGATAYSLIVFKNATK